MTSAPQPPYRDVVFGALDEDAGGFWRRPITYGNREITAELHLDGEINGDVIAPSTGQIDQLEDLEARARSALAATTEHKRSPLRAYRDLHAQQLEEAEAATCLPLTRESLVAFLGRCALHRVTLFPESPSHCLILDFTIQGIATDALLVVSFDQAGELAGIDVQK